MIRYVLRKAGLGVSTLLGMTALLWMTTPAYAICWLCDIQGGVAHCVITDNQSGFKTCIAGAGTCQMTGGCSPDVAQELDIDGQVAASADEISRALLTLEYNEVPAQPLADYLVSVQGVHDCKGLLLFESAQTGLDQPLVTTLEI